MAKWNGYWINAPESKQVDKEKEFLNQLMARIDYMCQARLSKRELFGMGAMQGLLANSSVIENQGKMIDISEGVIGGKFIVGCAYRIADAMIAEGRKGGE